MIPSRALRFSDIFGETFSLAARTFPRYALLFLLCIAPASWLVTEGSISGITSLFRIAQHQYNFTDQDLTALRNLVRDSLAQNNPAFRQEVQALEEDRLSKDSARLDTLFSALDSHPHVRITRVLTDNLYDLFLAAQALFIGSLLYLIGGAVLLASLTELGVQVFEERRQRLAFAFKRVFLHHLWSVLAIIILYGVASFALWVLSIALGQIDYIGPFLTAAIFVFWAFGTLGLSLAVPASISEDIGPIAAFKRSWTLTYGSKWRIFGTSLALGLILVPMLLFLSIVTSALFMGMSLDFWRHALRDPSITVNWLIDGLSRLLESSAIANGLTSMIVTPLPILFLVAFYYDLRTRHDGPLTYDEPLPAAVGQATPLWHP
jgi:hypothetical protein